MDRERKTEIEEMVTVDSFASHPLGPSTPSTSEPTHLKHHSPISALTLPQLRDSILRQWRPAAQRNLRNQWSKLVAYRKDWISSSSAGRSDATSLVNSYLSQKYMDAMDLGVLSDMPNIKKKACYKLLKQQELHRSRLLSSYKNMVSVLIHMINASRSMRLFLKAKTSSLLLQFSCTADDKSDTGDGGGIPVFTFWSVTVFEELAEELVEMFKLEVILKRLLVVEFLCIGSANIERVNKLSWPDELYNGEADDLSMCNLYSKETSRPVPPSVKTWRSGTAAIQSFNQPDHEVLQVYLTTWLAEVNLDTHRLDEIFALVGEEMHASFS